MSAESWPQAPTGRYIRIVGQPAAGKSRLCHELAERLELPSHDIVDVPGHPFTGVAASALSPPAMVETGGTSEYELHFWDEAEALVLEVRASEERRRRRLQERGLTEAAVRRLLRYRPPKLDGAVTVETAEDWRAASELAERFLR